MVEEAVIPRAIPYFNNKFIFGFFAPNPKIAGAFVGLSKDLKLVWWQI